MGMGMGVCNVDIDVESPPKILPLGLTQDPPREFFEVRWVLVQEAGYAGEVDDVGS